jgi:hypothetical protein
VTAVKKARIGAPTADQIAARCRALPGVRVELSGGRYTVYSAVPGTRPVSFAASKHSRGSHLDNVLRDLRRNGVDLERSSTPTPAAMPQTKETAVSEQDRNGRAMVTTRQELVPATRGEVGDLREMVRTAVERMTTQGDAAMAMLAEAERRHDALSDEVTRLRGEVAGLRDEVAAARAVAGREVLPPTRAEILRGIVFAYFQTIPGVKITPSIVEANCGDDLPDGRGKTDVAGACNDLFKAGKLKGVPKRDGAGRERGLYWYDPPADVSTDKTR